MDEWVLDIVFMTIKSFPVEVTESEAKLFNFLPTAEVVFALQKLVYESADATIESRAFDGLLKIDNFDSVQFLINLFDEKPEWRFACCRRFMEFPDKRAIAKLCEVVNQDNDPTIRYVAAEALGEIGDDSTIAVLESVKAHDTGENWEGFPVAEMAGEAIRTIQIRMRTT